MNKSSKHDFTKPKKHLGQNWLIDKKAIAEFVNFCDITKQDVVLEIGLGKGALTNPISKNADRVVCVEVDTKLINETKSNLTSENINIVNKNILDTDLSDLIAKYKITKIVSAMPYNITSPLIHKIIREIKPPCEKVYLIAQKEFAQKLIGREDKRSYFTNLIDNYGKITKGSVILSNSFYPSPKVNSMFFSISLFKYPANTKEVRDWEKFLHHVFRMPRKKIKNSFDTATLKNAEINPNLRPQNLSLTELNSLYTITKQSNKKTI